MNSGSYHRKIFTLKFFRFPLELDQLPTNQPTSHHHNDAEVFPEHLTYLHSLSDETYNHPNLTEHPPTTYLIYVSLIDPDIPPYAYHTLWYLGSHHNQSTEWTPDTKHQTPDTQRKSNTKHLIDWKEAV